MDIGLSLVNGQLLTSIFQTVHFHVSIKSKFICSVLTFYLSVVTRCSNPDAMIFDSHFDQSLQYSVSLMSGRFSPSSMPFHTLRTAICVTARLMIVPPS